MQTPSSPHSPPYPFYTPPSSPSPLPWQSYPMVNLPIQPGFHTSVEPVLNACSERPVGGFLSSVMGGTVSQGVAVTEDFSCQGQAWQMEQRDHYTSMEDSMGLAQQILEADVLVFDQSIQDPHCTIDMEQYPDRDINYAETSGRKSICEPYIGLEFRSEGEAYEFYKAYAKENGFSIRKSHVERSRVDHSLISRKYVCVRQGFRSLKDKRYEGKVVRHRRVTRIDCRAAMIVKRRSGKWVVHRFHKEHNHDLGDLATTCELQSLRKMTNSTKSILEALYKTQCIDMEDNIVLGQNVLEASRVVSDNCTQEHQHSTNVLEANMVVSDDGIQEHEYSDNVSEDMVKCDNVIQEQQHSTNVEESLKEDADTDETIGTKGIAMHESTIGDRNTAETTERDDNNASLVKLGSEPYMSLQFGSQDEAYEFYNAYAKEKGFSIRKSRIERSRIDHSMISRLYVCANQGLRSTKDKRYEGKDVRPRQETRLDCHAAMFIKRKAGKWVVERFHKEHNHDFVDPAKAEKLRSHRKMANTTKLMVEALYKCGLGPSKIVDLLTGIADGAKEILENNELD
ncbi:hypothetical protein GIB67_004630 [Kingdonia uniflora]|uniref:FAR1 domain-containing protein n=1 Tax=Kingdonia uniflora TaxID=39325 RepID=A0A7J7MD48_9MAGN|nr:hypothetical protein GIB67_004630 [Kingdonia uniflora]